MNLSRISRVDLHSVKYSSAWEAQIILSWKNRPSRTSVTRTLKKELGSIECSLDKDFSFRHDVNMDTTYIFFRHKTDAVSWYLMIS